MALARIQVPAMQPDDSDEVRKLLEAATIFGMKGETEEVIRWLKRAAEAAGESGQDLRAVALARAAADLRENGPFNSRHSSAPPSVPAAGSRPPPASKTTGRPPKSSNPPQPHANLESALRSVVPSGSLPLRQALRVCVTPGDKQDGSYVMRLLPDGEAAPPGATEAIIVAIQAQADLTRR